MGVMDALKVRHFFCGCLVFLNFNEEIVESLNSCGEFVLAMLVKHICFIV